MSEHRNSRRCAVASLGLLACLVLPHAHAATVLVDSLADSIAADAACTLREALLAASEDSAGNGDCTAGNGADSIGFDPALFSGTPASATIVLDPALGQLQVTGASLTIAAPAATRLVLQASGTHRVMHAFNAAGATLELRDIALRGGAALYGGGLSALSQHVVLDGVVFADNTTTAHSSGAALDRSSAYAGSTLQLRNCAFLANHTTNSAAGLYVNIHDDHDILIEDCLFQDNSAGNWSGAINAFVSDIPMGGTPELTVRRTRFLDNSAGRDGGAIFVDASSAGARIQVAIADSLFEGNTADVDGAAMVVRGAPSGSGVRVALAGNSFIDNRAAIGTGGFREGATVYLRNVDVSASNNLWLRNETWRTGALTVDMGASAVPRPIVLVANTFHGNTASTDGPGPRSLLLRLPEDSTGWTPRLHANAFSLADDAPFEGDCNLHGGPQALVDALANIAAGSGCIFGPGDTVSEPALVPSSTGMVLFPEALYPQPGSPAIDLWPTAACLHADGSPLASDLAGNPRPRDGDGDGTAACDAGAFELPNAGVVTVTTTGAGDGRVVSSPAGIDCPGTCTLAFSGGTGLVLTAVAEPGSVFGGWSGACSGTNACVLSVDGDAAVEAEFVAEPARTLALQLAGDGEGIVHSSPSGIACAPLCSASFALGSTVTLQAQPAFDAEFTGWSGGGCSGTGSCAVALAADTDVVATFTATAFVVDVMRVGTGGGSVASDPAGIACPGTCSALFAREKGVTLAAMADASSVFLGWEGDCSGTGACVLDMHGGPYAVDARFERLRQLQLVLAGSGSGSVSSAPAGIACPGTCSASYAHGTEVTLTATPQPGSAFTGWSGGACSGTGPCTVDMDTARTVTAAFQAGSNSLQVVVTGSGSVTSTPVGISCPADCSEAYSAGSTVTLIATPAAGFSLAGWQGACTGTGPCEVAMTAPRSVEAVFLANDIFADGFED